MAKMVNVEVENKEMLEVQNELSKAIESKDNEGIAKGFTNLAKGIETRVLAEAKTAMSENNFDREVMNKRGFNAITAAERTYYNEVITAGGFAGSEKLMPATIFERVFEDLKANHPLLSKIQFVNTTGISEFISRNNEVEAAWWGPLVGAITKKLEVAFKKESTELYKLSAYVPVAKAMLDLGPVWLDKFVREILGESMAMALESAILVGTGKGEPIGMNRDLAGAVVEGVYPVKASVVLSDFQPGTLGTKVMLPLTRDGKRVVDDVLMVVNPSDYWGKIFAMTTVTTLNGTFVYGVMPIPATIVQSVSQPVGKMAVGMARDYFMAVGSTQKIEFSDQYHFLEDERVYITKQYANGKPEDNTSFITFDISALAPPVV